jgi:small subunit ribosomal protein S2
MRAIQLYASGVADAVLEGKESVPTVAVGEDEFVELDEAGNPRRKSARGRQRPAATVRNKKAPPRRRPAPAKAPAGAAGAAAGAAPAPEEVVGEEDDLDAEGVPELAASGGTGEKAPAPARRPGGGGAGRRKGRD